MKSSAGKQELLAFRTRLIEAGKSETPAVRKEGLSVAKLFMADEALASIEDEKIRSRAAQALLAIVDRPGKTFSSVISPDTKTFAVEIHSASGSQNVSEATLMHLLSRDAGFAPERPISGALSSSLPAMRTMSAVSEIALFLEFPVGLASDENSPQLSKFPEDGSTVPREARYLCVFALPLALAGSTTLAQCMTAIVSRVAEVNQRYPDLCLSLSDPKIFSETLKQSELARISSDVRRFTSTIGGALKNGDAPKLDRARMVLTLWPKEHVQTLDVFACSEGAGRLGAWTRIDVSFSFSSDTLQRELAPLFAGLRLELEPISSVVSRAPLKERPDEALFLDSDGRWLPSILFSTSEKARRLINSARWLTTLEARDESELKEMLSWPFPFLYKQANPAQGIRDHFRKDLADLIMAGCSEPGVSHSEMLRRIEAAYPEYLDLSNRLEQYHDNLRVPYDLYLSLHFVKSGGRVFHVLDTLVERLDITDIEKTFPVSLLHAPFPDSYLHLQTPFPLDMSEAPEGLPPARLVGFFVTESETASEGGDTARTIAIAFVITERLDTLQGFGSEIEIKIEPNDSCSLLEAVNRSLEEARPGRSEKVDSSTWWFQQMYFAAKVLLYLGVKSARTVEKRFFLAPPAKKRSAAGTGNARAQVPSTQAYDFIEVGPEKRMAEEKAEAHRQGFKHAFWRRGFIRNQAYGPKWSLHREHYIHPTLVREDLADEETPLEPKDYRIK